MDVLALWQSVRPAVEAHARFAHGTRLDTVDWASVARGKVWSARTDRVVGVALWPIPRAHAWLAVTDDAPADKVAGLTERRLRGAWSESPKLLYERIDLPWPFDDRHWVIESRTNASLAAADPRVWERAWTLADAHLPQGRTPADAALYDAALRIGRNDGSWVLVDAGPASTLAIYGVRVDLGGNLPESGVARWTAASVEDLFSSMRASATDAMRRYAGRCATTPLPGGDGAPLPCP
jgi:hypothetical protein